jgi:hypothetical protein
MAEQVKSPVQAPVVKPAQKKQITGLLIGAGVILVGVLLLFLLPSGDIAKDGKISEREARTLKGEVGKLIVLPQEEPVMALVTNADQLIAEQPFYQGVSNGDVLIIYPQARKAILYSYKNKKLINVGPVNVGEASKSGKKEPATLAPSESTDEQ